MSGYPVADDPGRNSSRRDPEHPLRETRDRVIGFLLRRGDAESNAVLDRLAALDSAIHDRIETERASRIAGEILPTFDPQSSAVPASMSVDQAVSILDRAGYRLVRSADDLLDVTLEALGKIAADVGYDLAMLYSAPPPRHMKGMPKRKYSNTSRKHLAEDALQAYLRRRLLEILPKLADGVEVQILREDQIAYRQRYDLRVTAHCYGTRQLATVVIEVKWSMNPETRTALTIQLGDRYLRDERLTHGIYVVGWSGKWLRGDGSRNNTDLQKLQEFLEILRDAFCRADQRGAGLRIEPFILDLRWRTNPDSLTGE